MHNREPMRAIDLMTTAALGSGTTADWQLSRFLAKLNQLWRAFTRLKSCLRPCLRPEPVSVSGLQLEMQLAVCLNAQTR